MAIQSVISTTIGAAMLGRMWRRMIVGVLHADGDRRLDVGLLLHGQRRGARDAGEARHEGDGQMTTTMFQKPPPSAAAIMMPSSSSGKASRRSMIRPTIRSTSRRNSRR